MKTKIINSLIILTSIIVMIGCKTTGTTDESTSSYGVPACITEKITAMKAAEVKNPPLSLWQYQYNGQTVYYIPSYCCDIQSELYNSQCNFICSPDGGLTGRGDGKCSDFFDKRTDGKLIWKDDRTYPPKK